MHPQQSCKTIHRMHRNTNEFVGETTISKFVGGGQNPRRQRQRIAAITAAPPTIVEVEIKGPSRSTRTGLVGHLGRVRPPCAMAAWTSSPQQAHVLPLSVASDSEGASFLSQVRFLHRKSHKNRKTFPPPSRHRELRVPSPILACSGPTSSRGRGSKAAPDTTKSQSIDRWLSQNQEKRPQERGEMHHTMQRGIRDGLE